MNSSTKGAQNKPKQRNTHREHDREPATTPNEFVKTINSLNPKYFFTLVLLIIGGALLFVFVIGPLGGLFTGLSGLGRGFATAAEGTGEGVGAAAKGLGTGFGAATSGIGNAIGAMGNGIASIIDPSSVAKPGFSPYCCDKYTDDFLVEMLSRGMQLLCDTTCTSTTATCDNTCMSVALIDPKVYSFKKIGQSIHFKPPLRSCCGLVTDIRADGTHVTVSA